MNCRICGAESEPFARAAVLGRHEVAYFSCPACGFVQTEEPHWLAESYSEAINRSDVGLVSRNLMLANVVTTVVAAMFERQGRFVDYGGGYGMLVRLLRDRGFDFFRTDRYCQNLFAPDVEAPQPPDGSYELLTAFEVFEHLVDPVAEMERMLQYSRSIFLTTLLLPERRPKPHEWWYYGLEHGQHVSIYTRRSLQVLAERFGLTLYSTPQATFHLLSDRKLPSWRFSLATQPRIARLLAPFLQGPSLQASDYRRAIEHMERDRAGNVT